MGGGGGVGGLHNEISLHSEMVVVRSVFMAIRMIMCWQWCMWMWLGSSSSRSSDVARLRPDIILVELFCF